MFRVLARVLGLFALVMMLGGSPALAQNQGGNQGGNQGAIHAPEFDVAVAGAVAAIVAGGGIILARRRRRT